MLRKIMIIDVDNFLDTGIVDSVLSARGITVDRPGSREEMEKGLSVQEGNNPGLILVLHYTPEQLGWLLPLLREAESAGARVINNVSNLTLFSNYPARSDALSDLGLPVPSYFFGNSSEIPPELGEMVVYKSLTERLIALCPRTGIHCLNQPVYVEARVENPDQRVLTIYSIAGCLYARWKEDPLSTKKRTRQLVNDLAPFSEELTAVKTIAGAFDLVFFNAEFIGGLIVDVNTIANFFYPDHPDPLQALADWIDHQLRQ